MLWLLPSRIKVFEALGTLSDGRIEVSGNEGKVFSSSKGKFYSVSFDPAKNAIMANDNGSYWRGYLGYPSIAFLMNKGVLSFDTRLADALKGILWKDLNTKYKNDFVESEKEVLSLAESRGVKREELIAFAEKVLGEIREKNFAHLGKKILPPTGY